MPKKSKRDKSKEILETVKDKFFESTKSVDSLNVQSEWEKAQPTNKEQQDDKVTIHSNTTDGDLHNAHKVAWDFSKGYEVMTWDGTAWRRTDSSLNVNIPTPEHEPVRWDEAGNAFDEYDDMVYTAEEYKAKVAADKKAALEQAQELVRKAQADRRANPSYRLVAVEDIKPDDYVVIDETTTGRTLGAAKVIRQVVGIGVTNPWDEAEDHVYEVLVSSTDTLRRDNTSPMLHSLFRTVNFERSEMVWKYVPEFNDDILLGV